MKTFELKSGKVIKVDDEDYDYLSRFSWWTMTQGYAVTEANGRQVMMVHEILGRPPEGYDVDHINGDKLDNQRHNLRLVTRATNMQNRIRKKKNPTGFLGVHPNNNKFIARIGYNYKILNLGTFASPEAAARTYDKAARKLHGLHALTNFPVQ